MDSEELSKINYFFDKMWNKLNESTHKYQIAYDVLNKIVPSRMCFIDNDGSSIYDPSGLMENLSCDEIKNMMEISSSSIEPQMRGFVGKYYVRQIGSAIVYEMSGWFDTNSPIFSSPSSLSSVDAEQIIQDIYDLQMFYDFEGESNNGEINDEPYEVYAYSIKDVVEALRNFRPSINSEEDDEVKAFFFNNIIDAIRNFRPSINIERSSDEPYEVYAYSIKDVVEALRNFRPSINSEEDDEVKAFFFNNIIDAIRNFRPSINVEGSSDESYDAYAYSIKDVFVSISNELQEKPELVNLVKESRLFQEFSSEEDKDNVFNYISRSSKYYPEMVDSLKNFNVQSVFGEKSMDMEGSYNFDIDSIKERIQNSEGTPQPSPRAMLFSLMVLLVVFYPINNFFL